MNDLIKEGREFINEPMPTDNKLRHAVIRSAGIIGGLLDQIEALEALNKEENNVETN